MTDEEDKLSLMVADYYRNETMRRDSWNILDQSGQSSVIEAVMHENALDRFEKRPEPN